jgi:hypothetical protein
LSNYERNTSLVICIFAVLVIGAISVGLISYYGTNTWNWNVNPATTDFSFEAEVGATNETVTLDIDLGAGGISIVFVDNASLLYDIDMEVQNTTLDQDGAPTVTFASNTISLDYTAAGVNVTLGSGVNYTLDVDVSAGGVDVILGEGAHVGDVSIDVTTGGISLVMSDDVSLLGNATFDLTTTTGGIDLVVDYPTDVGGSIEGAASVGGVDITAVGWTMVTANHYETSDYDTASQTLTIIAQTTTGGINAIVT